MKIILGADHGGFELKNNIAKWLETQGHQIEDIGTFSNESVDYPDFSLKVAHEVANGNFEKGVLVCGSGVGVMLAANKVKGIRAVQCHDTVVARLSREHNDANIITMGGRFIAKELAYEIISVWLNTEFLNGRHSKRIEKITLIEKSEI